MTELLKPINILQHIRTPIILILTVLLIAPITFAHGPNGHGEKDFTALQAVQQGIVLYDRLVTSGKLAKSWETDLADVVVSTEQRDNNREFVVQFSRSKGEPKSVYIFFTEKGKYSGSNFGGK